MNEIYILCGITTLSVIIIIFLKKLKSDTALPLSLLLGIVLLRQALNIFRENKTFFERIAGDTAFTQYGNIIAKAFGITIIIELLSEFCKEAGENSIAAKIELLGKIELVVLSLPLIENILEIVKKIIF